VLQGLQPQIEKDVYECLSLRGSLNARNTLGGTAPAPLDVNPLTIMNRRGIRNQLNQSLR
jgi:argininosuccinate lyase